MLKMGSSGDCVNRAESTVAGLGKDPGPIAYWLVADAATPNLGVAAVEQRACASNEIAEKGDVR
jgi:hypothetical protein